MKAKLNIGFLTGKALYLNRYKCRWDVTVAKPHPDSATMYSTIFLSMECMEVPANALLSIADRPLVFMFLLQK